MVSTDHSRKSMLLENGEICVLDGAIPEIVPTRVSHASTSFRYVNDTFYNCGGLTSPPSSVLIISKFALFHF